MEDLGLDEDKVHGMIVVVPGFLKKDKGLDILLESLKILCMRGISPAKHTLYEEVFSRAATFFIYKNNKWW